MAFSVRRSFWLILSLTFCLFLGYSAVGERGFVKLNRMMDQRDDLDSRVHTLQVKNAELTEQVSLLRDDPATIEDLARTELGMVREGETVYILSDRQEDQLK